MQRTTHQRHIRSLPKIRKSEKGMTQKASYAQAGSEAKPWSKSAVCMPAIVAANRKDIPPKTKTENKETAEHANPAKR